MEEIYYIILYYIILYYIILYYIILYYIILYYIILYYIILYYILLYYIIFLILYQIFRYACPAITNDTGIYQENSKTTDRIIVQQTPALLPAATH